jgi:hypothetical protein
LNVIPTTDLVPLGSWIGSIQNQNTSFTGASIFEQPIPVGQTQFAVNSWVEAGLDYATTPDRTSPTGVFNVKAQAMIEDERRPSAAIGIWNVAENQRPGCYVTMSKTLNYSQEQEERFRAHHRRNRKLLGRRVHVGAMLDGHGITQPFVGTDLQLSETAVLQADWVHGPGNALTAGVSLVLPGGKDVLTPALLLSNDTGHFGLLLNFSHQFSL